MSIGQLTLAGEFSAFTLANSSSFTPLAEQALSPLEQDMQKMEEKLQKAEVEEKCEEFELIYNVGELVGVLRGKEGELETQIVLLTESIEQIQLVRERAFEAYKDLYREQFSKTLSHIHKVLTNFIEISKKHEAQCSSLISIFESCHFHKVCFHNNGEIQFISSILRDEQTGKTYFFDNKELMQDVRDFEHRHDYILGELTAVKVYQTIYQFFYREIYDLADWKGNKKALILISDGKLKPEEVEAAKACGESTFALIEAKSNKKPSEIMQLIQKKATEFRTLRDRILPLQAKRDELLVRKRKIEQCKLETNRPPDFGHVLVGMQYVSKNVAKYDLLNHLSHYDAAAVKRRGGITSRLSSTPINQAVSYMESEFLELDSVKEKLGRAANRYGMTNEKKAAAEEKFLDRCSRFGLRHFDQSVEEAQQFLDERPLRRGKGKAL